jgi:hypothetical protein
LPSTWRPLRTLAAALGTDGVRNVRGAKVARGEPRALSGEQYARLLRIPDLRTTGKRASRCSTFSAPPGASGSGRDR